MNCKQCCLAMDVYIDAAETIKKLEKEIAELKKESRFYSKKMLQYRSALEGLIEDIDPSNVLISSSEVNPDWLKLNIAYSILEDNFEYNALSEVDNGQTEDGMR